MNNVCRTVKSQFDRNEAVCAKTLDLLQLVGNKVRFRTICLLLRGDFCVQEIAGVVGHGSLSNTSQQLKILRMAGIVGHRREARKMVYFLSDERVRTMIKFLRKEFLASKK